MKLSVLVLTYNQEKTISQTLESILTQEHSYEYEILVGDDASKDNTPKIIEEYSAQFPDIIKPVLRQQNLGVVKNHVDLAERARGEYVMVCAGDDFYLPGKIKTQIEYLDIHPDVGLIHGDLKCIDEEGNFLYTRVGPAHVSCQSLVRANSIKAPTIAVRRKELLRYFAEVAPEDKGWLMEDKPLVVWFSVESIIHYLPGCYVAYRVLEGSLSHAASPMKYIDFMNSSFEISNYYQKRYPKLISYSYIINNHINNLLSYLPKADKEYRKKCLSELQGMKGLPIENYNIKIIRIQFPFFDIIWRLYKKITCLAS